MGWAWARARQVEVRGRALLCCAMLHHAAPPAYATASSGTDDAATVAAATPAPVFLRNTATPST